MKILYLSDNDLSTIGGSQKSIKTIINEMKKMSFCVAVFFPKKDNSNLPSDFEVYYTREKKKENKFWYAWKSLKDLLKAINSFNPDIIHAQNPKMGIYLGLLKKFKMIDKNIKCIFTDRGFFSAYRSDYQFLFKYLFKKFDAITTTTNQNLMEWKNNTKCQNIVCIPNVLEPSWFEYSKENAKRLRQQYNISNKITISFAGRFEEYKRWDTAFNICKNLAHYANVTFMMALTADNAHYEELMKIFINECKAAFGKQLLLFQNADEKFMHDFYTMSDIFVLTSNRESFGRTLIEAMAKYTVVFGTDSGGVPDVIGNEDYLFSVGDDQQVCTKIEKLVKKPEQIEKIKKYFHRYALNNFSVENLKKSLYNLYIHLR